MGGNYPLAPIGGEGGGEGAIARRTKVGIVGGHALTLTLSQRERGQPPPPSPSPKKGEGIH